MIEALGFDVNMYVVVVVLSVGTGAIEIVLIIDGAPVARLELRFREGVGLTVLVADLATIRDRELVVGLELMAIGDVVIIYLMTRCPNAPRGLLVKTLYWVKIFHGQLYSGANPGI